MKKLLRSLSLTAFASLTFFSCEDDPVNSEGNESLQITVQFETAAKQVYENSEDETLLLKLSKPALKDAILTIKTGGNFGETMVTSPAVADGLIEIPIAKGDVSAQISLRSIDNTEKDGPRVLNLALHNLPSQFIPGANKAINITVEDDETQSPYPKSIANFIPQEIVLKETDLSGVEYQIHFSEPLAIDSEIKITLTSEKGDYDMHYSTEPVADNNIITLAADAGLRVVGFKVKPVSNTQFTGDVKIKFAISETSGSIIQGNIPDQTLTIQDDELAQKPKGYEVTAGGTVLKKFLEYDMQGRISKINWETHTPYPSHGTETYFYDADGQLAKINKHSAKDILYHWNNGKITRSDEIQDGVLKGYALYDYDEHGNVAGAVSYHLRQNGTFVKGLYTIYLYFPDGNLYKTLTYQDSQDPEEPFLISTKTYDNYIDVYNPFPMTEVLPVVRLQTKLPTTYRVEENQTDYTYQMVYEFRPDGLPQRRIATTQGDSQTAVYHYY